MKRNKSIIKMFLTLNHCFWLKYESIIHNNASFSEKVHLLLSLTLNSSHIFVSSCFGLFWLVNAAWSVQISLLIQTRTLFHWRKRYYGLWTRILVKNFLMMDLFLTNMQLLSSQDVNWWTGMVWIIVMFFISCLDSHSDGTHSLQSIHCWDTDAMLHFSKSDEETNSSTR